MEVGYQIHQIDRNHLSAYKIQIYANIAQRSILGKFLGSLQNKEN